MPLYLCTVWRAQEIFEAENITDPGSAIPGHKMARLISLFLCGNLSRVSDIMPIIIRVTCGDGLDVVKVKELLQEHVSAYDEWAPEIDRALRLAALLLGPMPVESPVVENNVLPLAEISEYNSRFIGIPSAKEVYDTIADKRDLPLDPSFSNLVGGIAPYMSFSQVEYILQTRPSGRDWQQNDLRRLRYVYAVKQMVREISESYGGLSFLPQSFFVSVFLGEATRASLRARNHSRIETTQPRLGMSKGSTLLELRQKRLTFDHFSTPLRDGDGNDILLSPAGKVASQLDLTDVKLTREDGGNFSSAHDRHGSTTGLSSVFVGSDPYELGDSLLGPQDVAILLQAGLTSAMKGSTVVQLNQRMLLDLIASQPKSFAVAVLAEIGTPGGHGSPRGLTSALMALLELDQSSFAQPHRLDLHALLESWLPGFKLPRREDYLAGGRWARQSYYDSVFHCAKNILEDAAAYMALKGHIQRVRHNAESDPIPKPKEDKVLNHRMKGLTSSELVDEKAPSKLLDSVLEAKQRIELADEKGKSIMGDLLGAKLDTKSIECQEITRFYWEAIETCKVVLQLDSLAFRADWFKSFFRRNYDALMVKSIYDNVVHDTDNVRAWLDSLCIGARSLETQRRIEDPVKNDFVQRESGENRFFACADSHKEQEIVDAIINCIFFESAAREEIRNDPLVRLLISNPAGHYNFTIVSCMGVVTDGKKGLELAASFDRLKTERGIITIRSDTGTARSFEYNASKIEDAVKSAAKIGRPFGFLGYSQGSANCLTAEWSLLSGQNCKIEHLFKVFFPCYLPACFPSSTLH